MKKRAEAFGAVCVNPPGDANPEDFVAEARFLEMFYETVLREKKKISEAQAMDNT
jgi:hypothetical protein